MQVYMTDPYIRGKGQTYGSRNCFRSLSGCTLQRNKKNLPGIKKHQLMEPYVYTGFSLPDSLVIDFTRFIS